MRFRAGFPVYPYLTVHLWRCVLKLCVVGDNSAWIFWALILGCILLDDDSKCAKVGYSAHVIVSPLFRRTRVIAYMSMNYELIAYMSMIVGAMGLRAHHSGKCSNSL